MTHPGLSYIGIGLFLLVAATGAQEWDTEGDGWSSPSADSTPLPAAAPTVEAAPSPAEEAAPQDATYIIKPGDTLWDLSFQFLGDPFQWQRIWQVNSYIANPDLIYPGNQLVIPGRGGFDAQGTQGLTSETSGALDSASALRKEITNSPAYPGDVPLLTSVRAKNLLNPSFLATVPFLWTEKDQHGYIYPGNAVVDPPVMGKSWQLYSTMTFKSFANTAYRQGDTVDIFTSLRFVRFGEKPMNLVRRIGRACVQKSVGKEVYALLYQMSDAITGNERVAPAMVFPRLVVDTLVAPSANITAHVFTRVEETESPYPFQMIILDRGSMQGIELGDVFGIYHRNLKNDPARLTVIGTIGHVGEASSTLMLVTMSDNRISDGDQAVLLRRTRFSGGE